MSSEDKSLQNGVTWVPAEPERVWMLHYSWKPPEYSYFGAEQVGSGNDDDDDDDDDSDDDSFSSNRCDEDDVIGIAAIVRFGQSRPKPPT